MSSDQLTKAAATSRQAPAEPALWRGLIRWETALVFLVVATVIFGAAENEHFLNTTTIFFVGLNMGEIAIMALPLTLIVVTGEIDLSVASMLGLSSTLLGYLFQRGWPIVVCMLVVLVVGAAGGKVDDVVSMTIYVLDRAAYLAARPALGEVWRRRAGRHYPAIALVEVRGLVTEGALVELQALAVLA